ADQTKAPSPVELVIPGMFQEMVRSESSLMGYAYTGVGSASSKIKGQKARADRGMLVYMDAYRAAGATGWGIGLGAGDNLLAGPGASDIDAGFTGLMPMVDFDGSAPKSQSGNDMFQSASPKTGIGRTIIATGPDMLLLAIVQPHPAGGRFNPFGGLDLYQ